MSGHGLARLAPLVLILSVSLTACGGGDADPPATGTGTATPDADTSDTATPDAATPDADTLEVTVTRESGTFTPNGERVEVAVDQELVLIVTADEAGELHVHSTPEQEIQYTAGTTEHEITIDRPGVVEVESHEPDLVVLQLEVR